MQGEKIDVDHVEEFFRGLEMRAQCQHIYRISIFLLKRKLTISATRL